MRKTMLNRLTAQTREEWLALRSRQGIGGSEAAAALGISPWLSPLELWKQKTGISVPRDLSGNSAVEQGNRMEPILRDFFRKMHPEYTVEHHPFDILFQAERPYLFATLDGEIIERDTGRRGILEIKTATPNGKAGWEKWSNGNMPDQYYVQNIHQLLATGYEFVRLFAALFSLNGDITLREYEIERDDVKEDMEWVLEKETYFWETNVMRGIMPAIPLRL